jgi:hypothetical protein
MNEASFYYKRQIRRNTILSLIMSTLASTVSLSQFNITDENSPGLALALKIVFTVFAAVVAISTGFIKVYQVQEKLEKAIKLQQEWTTFGSMLSSELQLPVALRKDALYLIIKHKSIYTELFKQQVDISRKIVHRVAIRNGLDPQALSLSELFERMVDREAGRLEITLGETPMSVFETTQQPPTPAPTLAPTPAPTLAPPTSISSYEEDTALQMDNSVVVGPEFSDTVSVASTLPPRSTPQPAPITPPESDRRRRIPSFLTRSKEPSTPSAIQQQRQKMSKLVMNSGIRRQDSQLFNSPHRQTPTRSATGPTGPASSDAVPTEPANT